jgi:signal recognition particle GTPase
MCILNFTTKITKVAKRNHKPFVIFVYFVVDSFQGSEHLTQLKRY